MNYVYIVRCRDGSLYTGLTTHVARRVQEHNTSPRGAKYTRARRPVVLVYSRRTRSYAQAARLEASVKRLTRPQKIQLISSRPRRLRVSLARR